MSWWFSESLRKSCQRRSPGRAPSRRAPRHPCCPGSGRYLRMSKISPCITARWTNTVTRRLIGARCSSRRESRSSLGWGIGPCALPAVQLACRQPGKLLPRSSRSCPTLEMLCRKWAKFIFRELLILTLLAWCLSCYRTDLSCKSQETPCKGTRSVLQEKKLP